MQYPTTDTNVLKKHFTNFKIINVKNTGVQIL